MSLLQVPPITPRTTRATRFSTSASRSRRPATAETTPSASGCSRERTSAAAALVRSPGAHTDGDLLHRRPVHQRRWRLRTSQVFRWNGNDTTGLSSARLPIFHPGNVCGAVAGNDDVCGNRQRAAPSPRARGRSATTMAANTFVEAGIDMTTLLGPSGGCFASFLADSQAVAVDQFPASRLRRRAARHLRAARSSIRRATPGGSANPTGVATPARRRDGLRGRQPARTDRHDQLFPLRPIRGHGRRL